MILVGKPDGKSSLVRRKSRWVYNIKMDLREIEWDGMDCIDPAQNRDQWRPGKFLNSCTTGSFSGGARLRELKLDLVS
jgi:hypothetical protein